MNRDEGFLMRNKRAIIEYLNSPEVSKRVSVAVGNCKDEKQVIQVAAGLNPEMERICKP